jgi:hypothetical protein
LGTAAGLGGAFLLSPQTSANVDSARHQQHEATEILENVNVNDPSAPVVIEAATEKLNDGFDDARKAGVVDDIANAVTFGGLAAGAVAGSVANRKQQK